MKKRENSPVFKVMIRDLEYTYQVLTNAAYKKKHPKIAGSSEAVTNDSKQYIHFTFDGISIETVRHEVWHAYFDSLNLSSTEFEYDTVNEVIAVFMEKHLPIIEKKSQEIFANIKKSL